MARLGHARGARGTGGAGDALGVEEEQQRVALAAGEGEVGVAGEPSVGEGSPLSTASGTAARTPRTNSSRSAPTWPTNCARRSAASVPAAANAAIAGTSRVPDRLRSCPPPCSSGTGVSSRRSSSAPTPYGPPTLCPVTVIASRPLAAKSRSIWPNACTASECIGTPNSRATSASSGTGRMVPTSLFAHIAVTSATSSGPAPRSNAARSASGRTRPCPSTSSHSTTAPSWSASQYTASSTAWCSTGLASTRTRRASSARRDQNRPFTARLSDSVPPAVNTTSLGRAPSAAASASRDSSTVRRAWRPAACSADAFPVTVRCAVIARTASGSIGVVAA